jgi:hypothetical protein
VASLAWSIPPFPWQAVAYGRRLPSTLRTYEIYGARIIPRKLLYEGEGVVSSIVIAEMAVSANLKLWSYR